MQTMHMQRTGAIATILKECRPKFLAMLRNAQEIEVFSMVHRAIEVPHD
jgi:hypothetical protein